MKRSRIPLVSLAAAGHTVTGCDANVYPPMSTQLEALGIAPDALAGASADEFLAALQSAAGRGTRGDAA